LAQPDESPLLCAIENDAMAKFGLFGLHELSTKITPEGLFDEAIAANRAWLAEEPSGQAVGFLAAEIVDGNAHMKEIDVLFAKQGQGIGRLLVERFLKWAKMEGFAEATLTTFRDLPFNGPFYGSFGFVEIDPGPQRPGLAAIRAKETRVNAMAPRIAMAKPL
jgi:GNAT superfamily N-acetyltransferase